MCSYTHDMALYRHYYDEIFEDENGYYVSHCKDIFVSRDSPTTTSTRESLFHFFRNIVNMLPMYCMCSDICSY